MDYEHTQRGPLHLFLVAIGLGMLAIALTPVSDLASTLLFFAGSVMILLSFAFKQLTVRDEGEELLVRFGPLPLASRRIPYAEITEVKRARSAFVEGWGIHMSLGGGWVWNLWGFDCVDIHYGEARRLRLGSDDAEGLERFLKQRIAR